MFHFPSLLLTTFSFSPKLTLQPVEVGREKKKRRKIEKRRKELQKEKNQKKNKYFNSFYLKFKV